MKQWCEKGEIISFPKQMLTPPFKCELIWFKKVFWPAARQYMLSTILGVVFEGLNKQIWTHTKQLTIVYNIQNNFNEKCHYEPAKKEQNNKNIWLAN